MQRRNQSTGELTWHYGFPIELELLHRAALEGGGMEQEREAMSLAHSPVVYFEVASKDGWERHSVEGYGYWRIPCTPGSHEATVCTWKPQLTPQQQLSQYFLGGGGVVEDIKQVGGFASTGAAQGMAFYSRYGTRTEGSGSLNLRCQVVRQGSPAPKPLESSSAAERRKLRQKTMRRTVDDILSKHASEGRVKAVMGNTSPTKTVPNLSTTATAAGVVSPAETTAIKRSVDEILQKYRLGT
jgi:hypothetical protein